MQINIRLIDLASIQKNPNAGRKSYLVPGKLNTYTKDGITYQERAVTRMYSLTPEPEYLFKYEPMEAKCQFCHTVFSVNDLTDDYNDDDCLIPDICPVCNAPYCLAEKIQPETLEEALKRKAVQ